MGKKDALSNTRRGGQKKDASFDARRQVVLPCHGSAARGFSLRRHCV